MANFNHLFEQESQLKWPAQLPPDLAKKRKLYLHWRSFPVRDGAMVIYQFGVVAQGVRDILAMCPTVTARVDHKALRKR
jgi:hypothetical protein